MVGAGGSLLKYGFKKLVGVFVVMIELGFGSCGVFCDD